MGYYGFLAGRSVSSSFYMASIRLRFSIDWPYVDARSTKHYCLTLDYSYYVPGIPTDSKPDLTTTVLHVSRCTRPSGACSLTLRLMLRLEIRPDGTIKISYMLYYGWGRLTLILSCLGKPATVNRVWSRPRVWSRMPDYSCSNTLNPRRRPKLGKKHFF